MGLVLKDRDSIETGINMDMHIVVYYDRFDKCSERNAMES